MYEFILRNIRQQERKPFWILTGIGIFLTISFIIGMIYGGSVDSLGWAPLLAPAFYLAACLYKLARRIKRKCLMSALGAASDTDMDTVLQQSEGLTASSVPMYWVTKDRLIDFAALKTCKLDTVKKLVHYSISDASDSDTLSARANATVTYCISVRSSGAKLPIELYIGTQEAREQANWKLQMRIQCCGGDAEVVRK